jgi:DNA-binding LytR/AlgR family response regulator
MQSSRQRLALRLARDRRRVVDLDDVYFLEASGTATLVRLRDVRGVGELLAHLEDRGFVRIHRSYVVNLARVRELRLLDPPVNRVLPVSRTALERVVDRIDRL